jgi:hypothetical protein
MAQKRTTTKKSGSPAAPPVSKKKGNPVSKTVKVAGKRIGGAQRSNQARQQKRRDSR